MATLHAPLLSFSASGKIAKTMVMQKWKGLNVARQYVVPANPQTAAQTTQRALMASVVASFRNYFTNVLGRGAWNRLATASGEAMSGFNAFSRNAIGMAKTVVAAAFGNVCTAKAGKLAEVVVLKLSDGTAAVEAGNFEIWYGSKPTSLLLHESVAIAGGKVTAVTSLGTAGDVGYIKIRKDGFDRSGIWQITLIA